MGLYHKEIVGTYMGDPGKKSAQHEGSGKPVSGEFKRAIKDLPGQDDDYPKAGKDMAPSFQMLRNSSISKGSI